jgi:ribosomal protein L37AE/L43A
MTGRNKHHEGKGIEEQLVQKFPHRCPYCDQSVSYDQFDLKPGENEIQCPSCKKTYIRVVSDPIGNNFARKTPLPRRKGRKGRGK